MSRMEVLPESERRKVLREWNCTETGNPQELEQSFHELFEAQVAKTPEALAVVYEAEELTYDELNRRANQLGGYLRELGVGPDERVGICVERGLEMIVGLLGILKAGGAYVPLDPKYPRERLAFMLEDAQVPVLLTQEHLRPGLPVSWAQVISLDSEWEQVAQCSERNLERCSGPENLAYLIYTSGSTGVSKGVGVPHRGVCNAIQAAIDAVQPKVGDRNLQWASLSFDAAMFETGIALLSGATLYFGSQESLLPGPDLAEFLRAKRISTLAITPSSLNLLPIGEFPDLHTIIVLGEQCSAELVLRWGRERRLYNSYGPTEMSMWIAGAFLEGRGKPPIGKPIFNTKIYLLDSDLKPVPIGVPGNLFGSGIGQARGYLNRQDLTADSFIPDPFSEQPGMRMYRTGDLARWLEDGTIEFLGRNDDQVKIRGY